MTSWRQPQAAGAAAYRHKLNHFETAVKQAVLLICARSSLRSIHIVLPFELLRLEPYRL